MSGRKTIILHLDSFNVNNAAIMASAKNVDGFIPVYSNTMYVRDL